jgi:hypothetical protein
MRYERLSSRVVALGGGRRASYARRGAKSNDILGHTNGARHAAPRRTRTAKFPAAFQAVASLRQQVSRMMCSPRHTELAGVALGPDVPGRHVMLRAAQAPAFGAAVMCGLVLAWVGAVAPSYLDHAHSPAFPAQRGTPHDPSPAAPLFTDAGLRPEAMPTMDDGALSDVSVDPKVFAKLETVLAELDQDADRSEAQAYRQVPESPWCESNCSHLSPPGVLPELNDWTKPPQEFSPLPPSATVPAEQAPDAPSPGTTVPPAEPPIESGGPLVGPAA